MFAFVLIIFTIVIVGMLLWLRPYPAEPEYLAKAYANQQISISEEVGWIQIVPNKADSEQAIIFYPGGLVAADAYLYMLSQVAIQTQQSIYIVKFPLSLAVTNIDAASGVIANYPEIAEWTIMGHSLGGSMACRYAKLHTEEISKLVLLASYCDQSVADTNLNVLTLYGSLNKGIDENRLAEFRMNLPADATLKLIEGMNHAQFGNYGDQKGDNQAILTDSEATSITVAEVASFINY